MKFLTLFKIILISNVYILYGYTERIGDSPSDRYEHVVNKSIGYIQYFFSILNELEDLKGTTYKLICNIDQKVRNLEFNQGSKTVSGVQKLLNRLEFLSKHLQEQIDDWEYKLGQESITMSLDINSKVKVGDYTNTIKNLIRLYGCIIKLITKFNTLRDQTERHIENVSHDISNINTSMADKEETTKEIKNAVVKLTRELKMLTKDIINEITNCKKQLEDINQKSEQLNKITVVSSSSDKKDEETNSKNTTSDNKTKEDNVNKEKQEDNKKEKENNKSESEEKKEKKKTEKDKTEDKKSENDKSDDSKSESKKSDNKKQEDGKETKKEDEKDNNEVKKKSKEISIDDLTEEDIIEYFRNKKSKNNENEEKDNEKDKNKKDDTVDKLDKNIQEILQNIEDYKNGNVSSEDDDK